MPRFLLHARPLLLALSCLAVTVLAYPDALGQPPGKGGFKGKGRAPGELKKYDEVITKDAKTTTGVFTVHRLDDKVYFEIPSDALNKLMLWTIELSKGPVGVSWARPSLGNRVVRWERRGNKIYLWNVGFQKRGDGKAVQRAVDSANMDTVMLSFNVEAEGKDRSAVIEVASMFNSDVPDFSVKGAVQNASGIDDSRSYIEGVKTFPTNVEVRSLLTFRTGGLGSGEGKGEAPKGKRGGAGGGGRSYTAVLHHSLVQLPDQPMRGRYFDPRVGYFTRSFEDYAASKGWMEQRQYIARFRLEKKDPDEEVSEPVKPIVFYLSREVPEKWRKYLKQGIEDWQPAFEKAGFKNAIICKEAPDERQDPNWDAEDARHSVIRWVADPTQNAMGPHVHDPRSGEIISAHIIFWHDIVKLVQMWYFVQCGGSDPRVTTLPLPDEIIGEALRYVSCHEVGHTLGLRHNHRASQAFSIAQLRDPAFAAKNGTVASIMSYGRFNYVAQPEDKVKHYLPRLAPYDVFAIEWGYKPIAARSPEEERKTLDQWAVRQLKEPFLRFGGEDGPSTVDPTVLTENIGSDVIEATALGLKNLDRVVEKLVPATSRPGEDFSLLEEAYKAVLRHRGTWFGAVAKQVGGVTENRILGGRDGETFSRVPAEQQRRAVQFLVEHALVPPRKLLDPALVNRFKYVGVAEEVMSQQKTLLSSLLSGRRFRQLQDAEVVNGQKVYGALTFFNDVQDGVWSELQQSQPTVEAIRRSLHRAYLDHLKNQLHPKDTPATATGPFPRRGGDEDLATGAKDSDFRAVARDGLHRLAGQIEGLLSCDREGNARVADAMTRAHLEDCLREIRAILNTPKE
ncbi:MAG: zinc-dependent metalloprotease [Gemmataceae bacterium]